MSRPKRKAGSAVLADALGVLPTEIRTRVTADPADPDAALAAAAYFCEHGPQAAIVDLLQPFTSRATSFEERFRQRYLILLASGLIAARRLAEAEDLLEDEALFAENHPDRDYLLCRVRQALREFQTVGDCAVRYLANVDGKDASRGSDYLFVSSVHRAHVLTWLGEAYAQTDRPQEALTAFSRARDEAPDEESAYIGLARTLVRMERRDEAAKVVEDGVRRCAQHRELLMLKEYLLDRPRISACMIVKDEEKLLPGCLESIRDWVDEIVVVDTGSSDRTRDLAREYGARVFEQPWTGDFSHHRNYSIAQATGDWIFIVDADERFFVEDVPTIIDAMREGKSGVLSVGVFNVYGPDEERRTFCNSYRFFRRDLNLRYTGIVHNALEIPAGATVLRTTARIRHVGYDLAPERMTAKFNRTRELLRKQLAENPDDVFALFNYSELLRGVEPVLNEGNANEILECSGKVLALIPQQDEARRHLRLMALHQSATACLALKDYRRAQEYCDQALALKPDYLDALITSGLARYGLREYEAAIASFERYCRAQEEFDASSEVMPIILSFPDALDIAHNSLGALCEIVGRPDQAIRHYLQALQANPRFRNAAARLGHLYAERGEYESAERWFRHQLTNRPSQEALTGLADVLFQTGRFEQAESHYRQALAQYGASWALENDLGNTLYKQSRFGEAEQHYLRAAELSPDQTATYLNLALAQAAQGRRRECVATMEHYIQEVPGNPAGWQLIAEQLLALGALAEAQACFENTLRLDPHNTAALMGLADSYLITGQREAAAIGYRRVLQIEPANRSALQRLESIETLPAARGK